ncbi:MAG TPA: hypothetical protein VKV19_03275 [Ktedonobacteraceae bacterium]|nr:hypothetical protein [Ktedonobacteraceae bacterium]
MKVARPLPGVQTTLMSKRIGILLALLALLCMGILGGYAQSNAQVAHAQTLPSQGDIFNGPGKSHLVQDPTWVKAKLSHEVVRSGNGIVVRSSACPSIIQPACGTPSVWTLATSISGQTYEPPPSGTDAAGHSYTDGYMSNFCAEGASDVALGYWNGKSNNYPAGYFSTPHSTTYWNNSYNRAYLMYLATQAYPPSFVSPGEVTWGSYPYAYTATSDLRDTLNWEASGHNTSNWANYFYVIVGASSLSQSQLNADVVSDTYNSGVPLVAIVNTSYLPSWSRGGVIHAIAIIGYNNVNGTYTYVETCGPQCGSNGQGIYTISQSQLYNGIENASGNGGIVW